MSLVIAKPIDQESQLRERIVEADRLAHELNAAHSRGWRRVSAG